MLLNPMTACYSVTYHLIYFSYPPEVGIPSLVLETEETEGQRGEETAHV